MQSCHIYPNPAAAIDANLLYNPVTNIDRRTDQRHAANQKRSNSGIYVCPCCDRVYEATYSVYYRTKKRTKESRVAYYKPYYLHDWPRYGLEQKVCHWCEQGTP